jgi:hypothetical protein
MRQRIDWTFASVLTVFLACCCLITAKPSIEHRWPTDNAPVESVVDVSITSRPINIRPLLAAASNEGSHRFYSDGTESGATALAAENTNLTGQSASAIYMVRIGYYLTGTGSLSPAPKLQYNKNSAGWNDVNSSSNVFRPFNSSNIADNATTTNRLTLNGGTTFGAGRYDEVDGAITTSVSLSDTGNDETEFLFCIQAQSADIANADAVQLRLVNGNGTTLGSYPGTLPQITFTVAATYSQAAFMSFFEP